MPSPEEIAWAAGFFDGEGCITCHAPTPLVVLGNSDFEVLKRFLRVLNRGRITGPWFASGRKPHWVWRASGDAAEDAFRLLAPRLAPRRFLQARRARFFTDTFPVEMPEACIQAGFCDVPWAAGLFEAEGSITHNPYDLQVSLVNTDRSLVAGFDAIVERGKIYGPYSRPFRDDFRRKPRWLWMARGDAAQDVVELFGPWLSSRRRKQAADHGVLLGPTKDLAWLQ